MPTVELIDLSKVYGRGPRAVDRVRLAIRDGEFLVLVGPSGCGKSTLLRMIAGLEDVTEGEVRIGDRVVNDVAPKDRDIAMVFQNYALYPHMTVFENMAFGLRRRRTPAAEVERAVREAADLLGLSAYLERRPRELSGGERQRVALGRAMVRKPQVFLFDEPLSNLDAKLRVQMRRRWPGGRREGRCAPGGTPGGRSAGRRWSPGRRRSGSGARASPEPRFRPPRSRRRSTGRGARSTSSPPRASSGSRRKPPR